MKFRPRAAGLRRERALIAGAIVRISCAFRSVGGRVPSRMGCRRSGRGAGLRVRRLCGLPIGTYKYLFWANREAMSGAFGRIFLILHINIIHFRWSIFRRSLRPATCWTNSCSTPIWRRSTRCAAGRAPKSSWRSRRAPCGVFSPNWPVTPTEPRPARPPRRASCSRSTDVRPTPTLRSIPTAISGRSCGAATTSPSIRWRSTSASARGPARRAYRAD